MGDYTVCRCYFKLFVCCSTSLSPKASIQVLSIVIKLFSDLWISFGLLYKHINTRDMIRSGIVCCDLFLICVICILFPFHFSGFWIVYILFLLSFYLSEHYLFSKQSFTQTFVTWAHFCAILKTVWLILETIRIWSTNAWQSFEVWTDFPSPWQRGHSTQASDSNGPGRPQCSVVRRHSTLMTHQLGPCT